MFLFEKNGTSFSNTVTRISNPLFGVEKYINLQIFELRLFGLIG
jgi:hypothetical protein